MKRLAICLTLILCLSMIYNCDVSSNSGPTSWEGTSGAELLSVDQETPIEIINENLLFNFQDLSDEGYTVGGWITASYEMHNTSDSSEQSLMTFPMMSYNPIDRDDIKITVDGEPIDYQLHPHSIYDDADRQFSNIVNDIRSDYRTDTIFNSNTDGALWTFALKSPTNDYQEITLDLIFDPSETQLITGQFNGGHYEYGHIVIHADLKEDLQASIYYRGRRPTMIMSDNAVINDESMSFMAYYNTQIIPMINEFNKDSEGDAMTAQYNDVSLFNMLTERLQIYTYNQSSVVDLYQIESILEGEQIVSANYEVMFEADQTRTVEVSYKVKASMKNRAYGSKEDALYTFEYFLSPAKSWVGFGNLNIDVLLDDELWFIDDTNLKLSEVDGGFKQAYEGLPEDDIYITLRRQESEETTALESNGVELDRLGMVIGLLVLLCVIGFIGLLIVMRKKSRLNQ